MPNYDYRAAGGYHCTIVTQNRKCIFSKIDNANVVLSPLGVLVEDALLELPERFEHVRIDCYEIMPNHVHVILLLSGRGPEWIPDKQPGTRSGSLSAVIQVFKSRVSVNAKALGYEQVFQRGFNEHVIRDDEDLYNVRRYIQENPLKWELDRENPDRRGEE